MPIAAGPSAAADQTPSDTLSRSLSCSARASAAVETAKSMPMACTSMSRGRPIACRNMTPGTTNDPVMPVRIPFTAPIGGPAHVACRADNAIRTPAIFATA